MTLPANFDRAAVRSPERPTECRRVYEKHSMMLPVSKWRALGVRQMGAGPWPADDVLASLVEADGPGTDAYLAYGNYRALLGYNCSNYYAISVGTLADLIAPSRPAG